MTKAARRVISDVDSGDYHGEISEATYAALEAALAARQPVGQERVAWASNGATDHKVVAMPGLHKLPYGDYDLYAAPPPQAVDLDALQGVASESQNWIEFHSAGNWDYDDFLRKHVFTESHAVGNG
ncbi:MULTISPECIES: hypothetical protein [unclassified Stenotrophomonas]|uniref:hypothetical protein n=1 Tax=unclassified Stenotrophomonas TaxID=196198 RepID=UPI000D174442|nr:MULTISPECIES: hypothetical protein [unclassified Stenotrophomonas]PTA70498.1 hypothetical protein C9412_17145 [Stenotrophomonas sp. Nf1]PTA77380.1 hypothetical protein C9416_15920 [Stenotrophomonas sp. Nf4]